MNYRRVMRIPSSQRWRPRSPGSSWYSPDARRGERTAHRGGPLLDHRERHPGAQDLGGPATGTVTTSRNIATNPEVASGYRKDMTAVRTTHYSVVTANPLATRAACRVLHGGGTAADALVTAQAVLGLVQPQSSGVGGGGFLLYYDAVVGFGAGLRRPRGRSRGRDRELPALDLRHRPHRAQSRMPVHRAGPSACPFYCGYCRMFTPSTARPRGANLFTPAVTMSD